MNCENCPADTCQKLTEVELANCTQYARIWVCDDCLKDLERPSVGYAKRTGKTREYNNGAAELFKKLAKPGTIIEQ